MHSHKARTKPLHTRVILIARPLINPPLAAKRRLYGFNRHAVGHFAAVTAALAYRRINEAALLRINPLAALSEAPPFGGAGLVINQNRQIRNLAQAPLHQL
jgi:hypothetical protein